MTPRIRIRPGRVAAALAAVTVALALLGVAGQWLKFHGTEHSFGFISEFDMDAEANVPTWFSVALLLANAAASALIAGASDRKGGRAYWATLALLFLAASCDEAAAIHEMTILPLRRLLHAGGWLYYTWVVPAAALVAVVAAVYLRFLWNLPPRTRNLLALAALTYLGGAIGLEMVGGRFASAHGDENLSYKLIAHAEETAEMAGLVISLFALLDYAGRHVGPVMLAVEVAAPVQAAPVAPAGARPGVLEPKSHAKGVGATVSSR